MKLRFIYKPYDNIKGTINAKKDLEQKILINFFYKYKIEEKGMNHMIHIYDSHSFLPNLPIIAL